MSKFTLPSVLAFDRKLEPSDAVMFSGCWDHIADNSKWEPIAMSERRNRAVKSNFTQEVLENEAELQKQIAEANLSWGDDAAIKHGHDTLRLSYSLRIVSGVQNPTACNNSHFESRLNEVVSEYVQSDITKLAERYACNIANGRFLWRNRVGGDQIKIRVSGKTLEKALEFNAYDFSLNETTSSDPNVAVLATAILNGLNGTENAIFNVEAFVLLGDTQRVWPSQEMVLNGAKGEKSRHLFQLNGIAAMHSEKIGNALRTIDDWYPDFNDSERPIAIEAYGSVTQRGVAYRSSKNDFKTLLLLWLNSDSGDKVSADDKHFVVAMLIRGGVFGEGES